MSPEAQEQQKVYRQRIAEYRKQFGLSFVTTNRATVCYRRCTTNSTILEISTTLRNPKDQPNNVIGRFIAAERFARGEKVLFPIPRNWEAISFLHSTFY